MLNRFFFLLLIAVVFSTSLFAQDTLKGTWKTGGIFNINFNETGYQNWSAISDNVVNISGLASVYAKFSKGKLAWDNTIDIGYGQTLLSSIGTFRKSDDRVDLTSKAGYKASQHWFYTGLFNFKTIMTKGYIYGDPTLAPTKKLNSDFLSPARIELSLGMDYKLNGDFSLFVSPLANRLTICLDTNLTGLYLPVRPGDKSKNLTQGGTKTTRFELGASVKAKYQKEVVKNVNVKVNVELFSDYLDAKHNIDVLGDLLISLKVNKYLGATLGITTVYDEDIAVPVKTMNPISNKLDYASGRVGPRLQLRHTIGVGFAYKL